MIEYLGLGLVALLLVLLNGFFVLAEFAIVKVRATRLDELAERGVANAKSARQIIAQLDNYLSATQLGITLASLGLGWIGEPAFAGIFDALIGSPGWLSGTASHAVAMTAAFLFITFLHILVGELAPKSIAIQHSEAAALFCARPLRLFHRLFAIPLAVMNGASRALLRVLRVKPASETEMTYTEEEVRSILGASQERGGFSFHHLLLLENAFDFGSLRVADVEVPLDRVTFLDATRPWPENAAVIAEKRLSRYPLRDGPKGKFVGMVHVKSILLDLLAGRTPDLRRQSLKMPRVSRDLLVEVALRRLQRSGEHMGFVTDAKGNDVGIFTLEDIVEELIGDIHDEFEPPMEVSIHELLQPGTVLLDPLVKDREELLEILCRLAARGVPGADAAAAKEAVLRRQKAVPASIAGGVALPHARVPGLPGPRAAFARLRDGIDYPAPDGRTVRLVLLLLIPMDAPAGAQPRYFQRVASLMQSDYLRDRLLGADTVDEVREIFRIGETSAAV
jgi:CBS domain containing-hemolysin-like protein